MFLFTNLETKDNQLQQAVQQMVEPMEQNEGSDQYQSGNQSNAKGLYLTREPRAIRLLERVLEFRIKAAVLSEELLFVKEQPNRKEDKSSGRLLPRRSDKMDFIVQEESKQTFRKSLLLNDTANTDVSVLSQETLTLHPIYPIQSSAPIVFVYGGSQNFIVRPNYCKLRIVAQILQSDGSSLTANQKVSVVANAAGSLFESVNCQVNEACVVRNPNGFHIRDYVSKTFSNNKFEKETILSSHLFDEDVGKDYSTKNTGFTSRLNKTKLSQKFELLLNVPVNIFQQPSCFLPTTTWRIELIRNRPEYVLACEDANALASNFKLHILEATLNVDRVLVHQNLARHHQQLISKNNPVNYFVKQDELRVFHAKANTSEVTSDNLFVNTLPSHVIVFTCPVQQYLGNLQKLPFVFENNGVKEVNLYVDGTTPQHLKHELDISGGVYQKAYSALHSLCNVREGCGITEAEFLSTKHFIVFELTPIHSGNTIPIIRNGNMKLTLTFKENLSEDMVVCVIGNFPGVLQINPNGSVLQNILS